MYLTLIFHLRLKHHLWYARFSKQARGFLGSACGALTWSLSWNRRNVASSLGERSRFVLTMVLIPSFVTIFHAQR